MLPFWPNYGLGHPENYLFSLSKKISSGSKYQKIKLFNFEKGSTGHNVLILIGTVVLKVLRTAVINATRSGIYLDLNTRLAPGASSAFFLAEISVRSPRKLCIFII